MLSLKKEEKTKNINSNIQVSNLEKPSLGSIGVKTTLNEKMGLDIWQGLTAINIIEQMNYIPDIVTSKNLQNLLNDLYISTTKPPNGNSNQIIKFLETRLLKIKSSGHSKKLYELVKQLPESERWQLWKRWLIEYELITRKDKEACSYINEKSKRDADNFWQTSRIFCLSINNKLNQSQFILDLIKSRGFSDLIFENLFKVISGEKENFNIDDTVNNIKPLHLIMMDTLKIPIKVNYVAHLGIEYTDPLISLTYLTPKARSFLLDKKISYSFVSSDQIIENYKSVSNENLDIKKAFSNYLKKPNGYNRANIWLSIISIKDDIEKVESILKFMKLEFKAGRFHDTVNLYLPILEKINSSSLTKELNNSIEKLRISKNPNSYPENSLANILTLRKNQKWDWNLILNEKAWPIIPIIEKAGMKQPKSISWIKNINKYSDQSFEGNEYNKWNKNYNLNTFILTKSIEQAAIKDEKALTILLVARLVGDSPFVDFDLEHLLLIRKVFTKLGYFDLANKLTLEIMTSKFITF